MPNTRSKGAPLVPYDSELRKTICKMVNAQELEVQGQILGLEAETTTRDAQRNAVNDPPRVVDENEGDDLDLDGTRATGAILLHTLPPGVKFTITSTMIQLLNLKGIFRGAPTDDASQHLMNFVAICKSQEILGG
ncbi:hypothetical protein R3W88_004281 [Solanum pinnatisectum]|uniref:Uncharacterized protein n=1 Tax=Solanum pinnatisectum TaxID=50273 RepID=A0AAV9KA54_9SOLN|nr:hypothetical protein R3W88_004281 [Solanum pinnatisectum]